VYNTIATNGHIFYIIYICTYMYVYNIIIYIVLNAVVWCIILYDFPEMHLKKNSSPFCISKEIYQLCVEKNCFNLFPRAGGGDNNIIYYYCGHTAELTHITLFRNGYGHRRCSCRRPRKIIFNPFYIWFFPWFWFSRPETIPPGVLHL